MRGSLKAGMMVVKKVEKRAERKAWSLAELTVAMLADALETKKAGLTAALRVARRGT